MNGRCHSTQVVRLEDLTVVFMNQRLHQEPLHTSIRSLRPFQRIPILSHTMFETAVNHTRPFWASGDFGGDGI